MSNLRQFLQLSYNRVRYRELVEPHGSAFDKSRFLVTFRQFLHPLQTYGAMKFEGRGSLPLANCLALLYLACQVARYFGTGYLFNGNEPENFNLLTTLASTVGLLVLWTVCNWTTSALLEGEGSIRELWIASCYATLPYLVIVLPLTGLSGVFTLSEAVFLNTGLAIAQGWMLVLLFCGTMITQQFTVSRTIVCVLLTILLMLGVVFLLLLFFTIFQQMAGFVSTVFAELTRRG